ncbi:BON domain-containing protein [Betaproteobacteria bacterium SCN1]|jgi:hyperosmotically inducible protein|nr:BON domain-containing protein [Betaproteobacteria bacterium SCN1]MBN8759989.1 BON domain-containing protein [Thiobacillus sp.]ODU90878.1 MAG: hypothetical protein ABT21_02330 [Thiobacillus sp. SCN 65-179]OJW35696.1 MAG: hypothetical protein BGO61_06870 [Thiobacillus sp. 65-69]
MNITLKLAQIGLLATFATHAAVAANMPPDFAQYDTNKDGAVSMQEFAAHGGKEEAFRVSDANKDGLLSPDEFIKAQANKDRADAGKYLDDAWITTKVKTALLKETHLKGLDVGVETEKGTVVLSGNVNSEAQIRQAERIAAGIEGVKNVRNDLRLKSQG